MSDHTMTEILTGGAVLAAAVGFFAYAAGQSGPESSPDSYELWASFRSVEGISVGTDVRLAGVRIGSVTGIELNRETYRAETRFSVPGDMLIPEDSAISIASEGLLGGAYVEIIPGGDPFGLAPGEEIADTQGAVSLLNLFARFVAGDDG